MQDVRGEAPGFGTPAEGGVTGAGLRRLRSAVREASAAPTSARRQYRRLYRRMAVTDGLGGALGLTIAWELRFGPKTPSADFLALLALSPIVLILVFGAFRLYQGHRFTPAEEFRRIIFAVSVGVIGLVTLAFWSKATLSRAWLGLSWGLVLVLALLTRRVWHYYVGRERERGAYRFSTLIVGTNGEAHHLEEVLRRPSSGYETLGYIATGVSEPVRNGRPVYGSIRDLREVIRETAAECVFVASTAVGVEEMGYIAKAVRLEGVEVRVSATLPEVLSSRLTVQPVGGLMALSLRPARLTGPQAVAKRMTDVALSFLAIALTAPLWIAIAIAVEVGSPGPVLFKQRRVGQRGRPFTILKFRTMVVGAEGMLDDLRELNEADGPLFKLKDDPRVSRVGRWLRKWSLDELPQLVNVLRGDMSLVGPRPPLPEEVREYEDWQFDRLEVRPGITGLWQVSGRSNLSFDEYVRLDLFYIENWSPAYDLYIMAKTIPILLSRRGAY